MNAVPVPDVKFSKMDIAYTGVFLKNAMNIAIRAKNPCPEEVLKCTVYDHGHSIANRCEKVMRGIAENKITVESVKLLVDENVFFFLKVWKKDWDRRKGVVNK